MPTSSVQPSLYQPSFFVDRPDIKIETTTDEKGKWIFRFLKNGKWIVSAFSEEKMSEMTDILLNRSRRNVELILNKSAAGFLIEAKSAVYAEDYEKAIQILDWFIAYFPDRRELGSSLRARSER